MSTWTEDPRAEAAAAARELLVIALAAASYVGVRALTEGSVPHAQANARRLVRVEDALGIEWESALQRPVLDHHWLLTLANWVYIWGHWPVIVAAAVFLYLRHREGYTLLRNAMFVSGAIGFAFFALLPTAPPRLADTGLVDTVLEYSTSYRALQPPALTNQYAALPSLHFGWNLLVGIVLAMTLRRPAAYVFAAVVPLAMALSVVATANHYVADVLVGGLLVVASLVAVRRWAEQSHFVPTLQVDGAPLVALPRRSPRRQRPRELARGAGVGRAPRRG
jgi:hypothetical protein